jgi:hypothetical protein
LDEGQARGLAEGLAMVFGATHPPNGEQGTHH